LTLFLLGTIVNAVSIVFGSIIGLVLPEIPQRMRDTIMQGIGLCVVLIGFGMSLTDQKDILIIIISIVIGTLIGEGIDIENQLMKLGVWIERKIKRIYQGPVAEAFVAASLLFCVGSMAIVGAIQSGTIDDHKTLFAKSILDMVSSVVFSSTLGFGVIFAAVPVFIYEGFISFVAHLAGASFVAPDVIACMSAAGGLLIVGIGANLYGLKKIAVGNMLPALIVAPVLKDITPLVLETWHHIV
jgi:uncharacterized protein